MEICIYDTKVHQDDLTKKYLGNALVNVFFYHRTVVKVSILNYKYQNTINDYCTYLFLISKLFNMLQLFNRFWLNILQ